MFTPFNGASSQTGLGVTAFMQLSAADYVEIFVFQATGGALNFGSATYSDASQLQITQIA